MLTRKFAFSVLFALVVAGCGDSGTDLEAFNQIGGNFSGPLVGNSQGILLSATLSLTINQNKGELSGSYGLSGTLADGFQTVAVMGTGALDGSIQKGDNPSVNVTVIPGSCSNQKAEFSGAYDTANQRLTISGPVEFFDDNCQVVITYNSTIILTR